MIMRSALILCIREIAFAKRNIVLIIIGLELIAE